MPKFKVPVAPPIMVNPAPFTFPPKVAVPPVLVIETNPVVLKPAILWVVKISAITIGPADVKVPLFTKFPPRVSPLVPVANFPILVIVRGLDTVALVAANILAAVSVIKLIPLIITPPEAVKGEIHSSEEAFLMLVVSYCKVAFAP
jgi:hypothetical protein